MSYDLVVFAPRAADEVELMELVTRGSGLGVETATGRTITVVRGARRRYSFTVDGPDGLELEDVPADVARAVLGSRFVYSILVEGSADSEVTHAIRFARRMAQALDGAVVDQQTDEVWSRSRSRTIQRPEREARVATVDLDWYCLRDDLKGNPAELFIEAVQRALPEALPRRFGEYEPLQGKLADSGISGFVEAWTAATDMLFTSGSGPCVGGHLSAGPNESFPDKFWSVSLTFLADPMRQPAWREALRTVFVNLADGLPAFYASAQVIGGHIWSGRSLWSDGDTEWPMRPVRYRAGWMGLPPNPTWWSWLGAPFAEWCVRLPAERVLPTAKGWFFEAARGPAEAAEVEPLSRWFPADLFATLGPNPHRQQPVPLVRAATIPVVLA